MNLSGDPFDSYKRILNDKTGVTEYKLDGYSDGVIIFHTIVGDKYVIIDTNGNVLKEIKGPGEGYEIYRPAKPTEDGYLNCILKDSNEPKKRHIASLDQRGNLLWKISPHWLTHDFHVRLDGQNFWTIIREDRYYDGETRFSDNALIEVNRKGKILWKWSLWENIDQFNISKQVKDMLKNRFTDNPFHVNSIQFADYDYCIKKFGEPVFVLSARNINTIFFVGRNSQKIKLELNNHSFGQHHVRILPSEYGEFGGNNLIIFDNGMNFLPEGIKKGYSKITEINLDREEVVWEYRSRKDQPKFYCPIVGSQQRFKNGNTLITEGYYGRIFEIDYNGEIVWDYTYPNYVTKDEHRSKLYEVGLRQIYRAYKIDRGWVRDL